MPVTLWQVIYVLGSKKRGSAFAVTFLEDTSATYIS